MRQTSALVVVIVALIGVALAADLTNAKSVETFDYVVVGGGGAGSLFGARLSEKRGRSVVVLEAGPAECAECDASALGILDSGLRSPYGADRFTTKQLFTARAIREIRGQLPGGSTRLYGGVSIPTSKSIFDSKYPAGMNYNTMLPYLNKMQDHYCHYLPESQTGISPAQCAQYHGVKGGPMSLRPPYYAATDLEVTDDLKQVTDSFGIRTVRDIWNPANQTGSYIYDQTSFRNVPNPSDIDSLPRSRESTWTGYLPEAVRNARPNLSFRTEAKVVELVWQTDLPGGFLFVGVKPKVIGVVYLKENQRHVVFAKRQVVLSAGLFGSVELLQNNGVGPASLLNSVGVEVVAENNWVGQDVAAHQAVPIVFLTKKDIPLNFENVGQSVKMHIRTPTSSGTHHDVEVEILTAINVDSIDATISGSAQGREYYNPASGWNFPFFTMLLENVEPDARGSVNISGTQIGQNLVIDYGWPQDYAGYVNSKDYQKLKYTYDLMRSIFLTNNSFSHKWIQSEITPGPPTLAGETQADRDVFSSAFRQHGIYHMTGGLSIGKASDTSGRINGIDGLTHCDNAAVPYPPNANPTTTMLAVCEYVADKLKAHTQW